jgi:ATP-dependent Clp protease, protease subunit
MDKLLRDMFDDRTIILSGELCTSTSTDVVAQLLLLNTTDPDRGIRLYIDSATGSPAAGFAICDTISRINPEVSTWAIGTAGSAATLVLCSGTIGKRYALPGSDVVLEFPGPTEGSAGELREASSGHRRPADDWAEDMIRFLSERTGKHSDAIARDLCRKHHLSATDSVSYGIVDRVMPTGKYAPQNN